MNLLEEIRAILAPVSMMSEEDIMPDNNLRTDIGLDSFGTMDAVASLEDKYGINIADEQISMFITVKDIMDYVKHNTSPATIAEEKL